MKEDERALARVVLDAGDFFAGFAAQEWWEARGYSPKRLWSLLTKWTRKGWWEYGVSLRAGWLTDEGRTALRETNR